MHIFTNHYGKINSSLHLQASLSTAMNKTIVNNNLSRVLQKILTVPCILKEHLMVKQVLIVQSLMAQNPRLMDHFILVLKILILRLAC